MSVGGWLREVEVRPVRGVEERRRWDALMAEHHYLPFRGLFGKSLRHVAVRGEAWLALLGWQAGAFKVGVRDAWVGWSREQQFSRLHLIANNSRFAVLEAGRVPNLASRALCTTCATSPTTRTAAGRTWAICRAISPA